MALGGQRKQRTQWKQGDQKPPLRRSPPFPHPSIISRKEAEGQRLLVTTKAWQPGLWPAAHLGQPGYDGAIEVLSEGKKCGGARVFLPSILPSVLTKALWFALVKPPSLPAPLSP